MTVAPAGSVTANAPRLAEHHAQRSELLADLAEQLYELIDEVRLAASAEQSTAHAFRRELIDLAILRGESSHRRTSAVLASLDVLDFSGIRRELTGEGGGG